MRVFFGCSAYAIIIFLWGFFLKIGFNLLGVDVRYEDVVIMLLMMKTFQVVWNIDLDDLIGEDREHEEE